MTVLNPPAWLQAGEYPAHTDRQVIASLVQSSGVVSAGDLNITANGTANMTVWVSAGRAFIQDASSGGDINQGMYNFVNDAPVQLTVTPAHVSQGRIDRVVARVEDAAVPGTGTSNTAVLQVVAGTPSGSPSAPATPTNAISLGLLDVPANATQVTTARITNHAVAAQLYRSMTPAVSTVTSSTRPTGSARITGMLIFETDTLRSWQWTGSTWVFRGGPAPRAFVARTDSWNMSTADNYVIGIDPDSGSSNFETAYFTFRDLPTEQGDRIRVKQDGLYQLEIYANVANFSADFYITLETEIVVGNTGLVAGRVNFPSLSGTYPKGRSRPHSTRLVYLPEGAEIAYKRQAAASGVEVAAFWASATLIG